MAPPTEEPVDAPPVDSGDAEGDLPPVDGDVEDEGENADDYMSVLKKMAGKLQQKINKYEDRLESSEYKEVIKQVLSAVDLNKLEEAWASYQSLSKSLLMESSNSIAYVLS